MSPLRCLWNLKHLNEERQCFFEMVDNKDIIPFTVWSGFLSLIGFLKHIPVIQWIIRNHRLCHNLRKRLVLIVVVELTTWKLRHCVTHVTEFSVFYPSINFTFFFSVVIPFKQFLTIFFVKMIELVVRKPGNSKTTKRITQKENN